MSQLSDCYGKVQAQRLMSPWGLAQGGLGDVLGGAINGLLSARYQF